MRPSFCILDIETSGGSFASFPNGFDLLLTGVRYGRNYGMYTAAPVSMAQLSVLLETFPGPIVTFNGARFDIPLLQVWSERVLGAPLPAFRHYDLMVEIVKLAGHRIGLENVCLNTFGSKKVPWDHRHNARIWKSEPHKLVDYNRVDLDLTHELFMRVLRQEPLFLGHKTIVLPLPD